jgi:exonuclease III
MRRIFDMARKMKLVSWNCNGAFRRKRQHLEALRADVLVIQECEDPARSEADFLEWAGTYLWRGPIKSKGIGIFARQGLQLAALPWAETGHGVFLPARVDNKLTIFGVWTQQGETYADAYIGQFWHYLQANRARLDDTAVICGDFNSNSIWDRSSRKWNHSDCVRDLEELGFSSLYHSASGEPQGEESGPSFVQNRARHKPFHIDYAFVHGSRIDEGRAQLEIGDPDFWLQHSDHLPLIVQL